MAKKRQRSRRIGWFDILAWVIVTIIVAGFVYFLLRTSSLVAAGFRRGFGHGLLVLLSIALLVTISWFRNEIRDWFTNRK